MIWSLKRFFLLCISLLFVSVAHARLDEEFSPNVSYPLTSIGTCTTGSDIYSSGGCGMTCKDLCDQESVDGDQCWSTIQSSLRPWNSYEIKQSRTVTPYGNSYYTDYDFASFSLSRVCSTSDKMCPSASSCDISPRLWAGRCDCSIGEQYKVCCQAEGDLNTSSRRELNAVASLVDEDGSLPSEGDCPLYGSGQETVFGAYCPQPPKLSLTANNATSELKVFNGETVTLKWNVSGYDRIEANITGVPKARGDSDPQQYVFQPFLKDTAPNTKLELWIRGYDDYRGYSSPNASDISNRSVSNAVTLTIISLGNRSASNTPPTDALCPVILNKEAGKSKCADYSYTPKNSDGSVNYFKDSITLRDPASKCSCPQGKICCELPVCSRCSNSPSYLGSLATWSPQSFVNDPDYINKTCATTNISPQYAPSNQCAIEEYFSCKTSGNLCERDVSCKPGSAGCYRRVDKASCDATCSSSTCSINDWNISPNMIQKGDSVEISWSAVPNVNNSKDAIKECLMSIQSGNEVSRVSVPFSAVNKKFGPILKDTTYTLNCSTISGNQCSAGGIDSTPSSSSPPESSPPNEGGGVVQIGCMVDTFEVNNAKSWYSIGDKIDLNWQTEGASSCTINNQPVSVNGSSRYTISKDGGEKYTLACKSKEDSSRVCSESLTVGSFTDSDECGAIVSISPSRTEPNRRYLVSWDSYNATQCYLKGGKKDSFVALKGSIEEVRSEIGTYSYEITCSPKVGSSCTDTASIQVRPADPKGCIPSSSADLKMSVSASRQCVPYPEGNSLKTNVSLNWSAEAGDRCNALIGGKYSSEDKYLDCLSTSSNWDVDGIDPGGSLSGREVVDVEETSEYSYACYRGWYSCEKNDQVFSGGDGFQNLAACESAKQQALTNPNVSTAVCSPTGCVKPYNEKTCSYKNRETCCASYNKCGVDGICENIQSRGFCSETGSRCLSNNDCSRQETCMILSSGTCSNDGSSCANDTDCFQSVECEENFKCNAYQCERSGGKEFLGYRLSVTSKPVCSAINSESVTVRRVPKPKVALIEASARSVEKNKYQILLNQVFDILWRAEADPYVGKAILQCTPSDGGKTNWSVGGLNSLPKSGKSSDSNKRLSPQETTSFSLQCRNQDIDICGASPSANCGCYDISSKSSIEVKVYTPDLKERVPTSYNLKKWLGSILSAF